jgi:hypothetical protein
LQVIENIAGLSPDGAAGVLRSTRPADWLSGGPTEGRRPWLFDPALLDAASQIAALWSRTYHDEASTETRYGRVVRYRHPLPERILVEFTTNGASRPGVVVASATFRDSAGDIVLVIEDLVSTRTDAPLPEAGDAAAVLSESA